ncbi:hypothetical protein ACFFSY_16600 [Paenibacillus aurantiacus]|uniref:Uncharacterized protein n=1 Tax=Paenibacillus aurantiacus TaxID=1936118 RepID=A0ABV5KQP5_9BACL
MWGKISLYGSVLLLVCFVLTFAIAEFPRMSLRESFEWITGNLVPWAILIVLIGIWRRLGRK